MHPSGHLLSSAFLSHSHSLFPLSFLLSPTPTPTPGLLTSSPLLMCREVRLKNLSLSLDVGRQLTRKGAISAHGQGTSDPGNPAGSGHRQCARGLQWKHEVAHVVIVLHSHPFPILASAHPSWHCHGPPLPGPSMTISAHVADLLPSPNPLPCLVVGLNASNESIFAKAQALRSRE